MYAVLIGKPLILGSGQVSELSGRSFSAVVFIKISMLFLLAI